MKIKKFNKILIILFLIISNISNSQTIVKIQDSTFINLDNTYNLVILKPSINPIRKSGIYGGIWTPSQDEKVIINISNLNGKFNIPFVSSIGNTIPFDYTIINSGDSNGRILFNTYETNNYNLPYPTSVTNVSTNNVDNSSLVIDRFWIIDVSGYSIKPKGNYTFTYDDNDLVGNTISESNLFMQRWNDVSNTWGDWLYSPSTNITTNTIVVNISNTQDQFKVWTAVDQSLPLPIKLISFKSDCYLNQIEWITSSEINNEWFILQGSNDGINFTNLDTVIGSGNSNQILYYSLPINENYSYFRLQQKDFDGHFENSFIIYGCLENNNIIEPILFINWINSLYNTPKKGILINWSSTALYLLFAVNSKKFDLNNSNQTILNEHVKCSCEQILKSSIDASELALWTSEAWSNGLVLWSISEAKYGKLEEEKLERIINWFRDRLKLEETPIEDKAFACIGLFKYLEYLEILESGENINPLKSRENLQLKLSKLINTRVKDFVPNPPLFDKSYHSDYYTINLKKRVINISFILITTLLLTCFSLLASTNNYIISKWLSVIPILIGVFATVSQLANFEILSSKNKDKKNEA